MLGANLRLGAYSNKYGKLRSMNTHVYLPIIVNSPGAEPANVFEANAELPIGILKDCGLGINSAIFSKNYIFPLTL